LARCYRCLDADFPEYLEVIQPHVFKLCCL
jgi:hypothetical protein